jgi:hypothetical protein
MESIPRPLLQVGLAAVLSLAVGAQARDADTVLRQMRTALGGEAALDAVKTWSVSGSVDIRHGGLSKGFSLELLAMMPDHFMEVRRDSSSPPGPVNIDIFITYYRGFAGDGLIRRTDSNIPFPQDPGPQAPQAIAARAQKALESNKRDFARLAIALFGKSFAGSPFDFSYSGAESIDGQPTEVVEMRAPDGFVMRLHVAQATHLPAVITWQAPPDTVITTSSTSTVAVRGGQVVSQSPQTSAAPLPSGDPSAGLAPVTWKMTFADFKVQDGLNWPHRIRVTSSDKVTEDTRLGKFKINPKMDARKFNFGLVAAGY